MISVNGINDKLVVFLDGAVTTNELQCFSTFSFVNKPMNQLHIHRERVLVETNGASEVVLAEMIEENVGISVETIGIYNSDTDSIFVNIGYNDGTSTFTLKRVYLAPSSTLSYSNDNGWSVDSSTDPATVPGTVQVKKSDDVLISSVDVLSGATTPYNVVDSVLTVDSAAYVNVKATDTFDVKLVDQDDVTIVPTSIIGDTIKITTGGGGATLPSGTYTPKNAVVGAFDLAWTGSVGVTTGDGSILKTGGTGWNASAYCYVDHYGDFELQFNHNHSGIGSKDSLAGISFHKILNTEVSPDFLLYRSDTVAVIQERGIGVGEPTITSVNDTTLFQIIRSGTDIIFKADGVTKRTVSNQSKGSFNIDSCIFQTGVIIDNIQLIIP